MIEVGSAGSKKCTTAGEERSCLAAEKAESRSGVHLKVEPFLSRDHMGSV